MAWDIGSIIGSAVGAGVGKAIGDAATPFTNAWVETKKAQSNTSIINAQVDRDMTIKSFEADIAFGQTQAILAGADSSHRSTAWIRPVFCALSFVYVCLEIYFWAVGKPPMPIDPWIKYVLLGIPCAVFAMRPYEKNKRNELASSLSQTQAKAPSLLERLKGK